MVVDHGSRNAASNASLELVAREIAALAGDRYVAVLPAHMELAAPSIADAFEAAVAAGATFVVVSQYFLAPGRHSAVDVPRLSAEAAALHPGLGHAVAASLGPHPSLCALVIERAAEALEPAAGERGPLRSARDL
ncbi:MAG: CbiX/SirB N-terminal domain-containing protein [Candidatus Binatia bacterium]